LLAFTDERYEVHLRHLEPTDKEFSSKASFQTVARIAHFYRMYTISKYPQRRCPGENTLESAIPIGQYGIVPEICPYMGGLASAV
jgi:hypothetical protein